MSDEQEMNDEAKKRAQEANNKRNNERLKLMEQIADASETGRKEDLEGLEREVESEAQEAEATAKALQEEGASREPETASQDEKVINGETHYLQVVNGREKWMTLKQIREAAQKVESADEYLRQASEAVRSSARAAPSPEDEPADLQEEEVRKLLAATALGDEEAIGKLARAIVARPSLTDVLPALDQRMSFRTELASLEAKSRDLLEDPYMGRLFRARINELKAESPNTKLSDAYTSIDNELRAAFPGFRASTANEKLERKRTLSQVPNAAQRQQTVTDDEGEEDPSAVIERMAKARGMSAHLHRRQ
jgi:hypothetical protein